MYGIFSIHRQLAKHNMTLRSANGTRSDCNMGGVAHVAVVPSSINERYRRALVLWLGEDNIRTVEKGYISDRIKPEQEVWTGTFNKLWLFNLTEFDKIIMLDADILIRSNIMHWFNYSTHPTPCAIQARDDMSWNTGAMVIQPDTQVFEQMLSQLGSIQKYENGQVYSRDPLIGGYSDQDFITAFFLNGNNKQAAKQRCVMPSEAAVLTSSLRESKAFDYYNKYRPWVYQTVHFTVKKPWRSSHFFTKKENSTRVKQTHPFICSLLREWNESVRGIEEYYDIIPPLENDYMASCNNTAGTA